MSTPPANARQRSPRRVALWLSLLLVFIAELLLTTWVRVQCNNLGYEIATLNRESQRLVELQDNLRVELARLKSPQRITRIAREMGLTVPAPAQVMVLPGAP